MKPKGRVCKECRQKLTRVFSSHDKRLFAVLRCEWCGRVPWLPPACDLKFRFRPNYTTEDDPGFENAVRAIEDSQ